MNFSLRSLLLFLLLVNSVSAQSSASFSFNLPAQPLSSTLNSLANVTGIKLIYADEITQNKLAPPLQGDFTLAEALNRILNDNQLSYELVDNSMVAIKPNAPVPARLPEITVRSDLDPDSPYNTRYSVSEAVTATKTNTPIMETPMNIQVVPKAVLNDQQAITLEQSLNNVSGVAPGLGFNLVETFNIRGFNTFDYYRNGVRFQSALTQTGNREVANLERIEVLKGPASILFGRIEPGGMINLVPKTPQATPYYSLQQQFGSYDLYRTTLDATNKLNQDGSLLYRLNFAYEDKGSFRQFVDNHHFFVAPIIQWRISDRTQITAEMEYKTGKATLDYGFPAIGNRPVNLSVNRNLGESFSQANFDEIMAGFHWSHAFNDNWEVKHRFYLQRTDENDDAVIPSGLRDDNRTLDRFFAGFRDNKVKTYTTSLDLTGKFETLGVRHTVLMGGDYYHFNNTGLLIDNFNFPAIDIFNPVHSGVAVRDPADDFNFDTREEWFGLYFQDQIKLPHNVHVLAGFRYDNARIRFNDTFGGETTTTSSGAQERVSPRVGILWQPIKPVSFYGNYVENFGIPNAFFSGIDGQSPRPETAQQWEAGIKTEFLDGRFSATAAWFHLTKQNIATSHPDPELALRGFSVLTGEARNEGVEVDITGELLPGWNIIANYAYIDSEIIQNNDGTQGNRFPNVPKHAGNIWTTYAFQNETLRGLKIGGGVTLRGKREGNQENDFQMQGYDVFNLMTSYAMKVGKSRITAQLNVNNLFNEEYFPSSGGFNRARIAVGMPRVFLGSVRIEY
jgi:iron complex outermembrane receptor protein